MIAVPAWEDVEGNYVGGAARTLGAMMDWRQPPPGGRLVLWHGEPGTGKTTRFARSPAAGEAGPSFSS